MWEETLLHDPGPRLLVRTWLIGLLDQVASLRLVCRARSLSVGVALIGTRYQCMRLRRVCLACSLCGIDRIQPHETARGWAMLR